MSKIFNFIFILFTFTILNANEIEWKFDRSLGTTTSLYSSANGWIEYPNGDLKGWGLFHGGCAAYNEIDGGIDFMRSTDVVKIYTEQYGLTKDLTPEETELSRNTRYLVIKKNINEMPACSINVYPVNGPLQTMGFSTKTHDWESFTDKDTLFIKFDLNSIIINTDGISHLDVIDMEELAPVTGTEIIKMGHYYAVCLYENYITGQNPSPGERLYLFE